MSKLRTVMAIVVLVIALLSRPMRAQLVAPKDILVGGRSAFSYGLGCDGFPAGAFRCLTLTEGGQTFIRMEYLGGSQAVWGALFITVGGDPRPKPRPSEDFSAYEAMVIDVRGKNGGERPLLGFKTNDDDDNGLEPRVIVERSAGKGLTRDWDLFTIPLDSRFDYKGVSAKNRLKQIYTVVEFVFGDTAPQTVDVRLVSFGPARPAISRVTNAASFSGAAIAPGEIASVFGAGFGPADGVVCGLDAQGRLLTTCGGTRVLFDGVAAPLFYVRRDQINCQVPYEVAGKTSTKVQVFSGEQASPDFNVVVDVSAPGVFVSADGRAAAVNQNGRINSPQDRASREEVVTLFATGEGQTDSAGVTGRICAQPLTKPRLACSARIGGASASIEYCGCAPGFAGLLQVNARISPTSTVGEVPVSVTIGNNTSQGGVTLSVR